MSYESEYDFRKAKIMFQISNNLTKMQSSCRIIIIKSKPSGLTKKQLACTSKHLVTIYSIHWNIDINQVETKFPTDQNWFREWPIQADFRKISSKKLRLWHWPKNIRLRRRRFLRKKSNKRQAPSSSPSKAFLNARQ